MSELNDHQASSRVKLLLILSIGLVPMMIAYGSYFLFGGLAPSKTTNEGYLIVPPRHVEDIAITHGKEIPPGKWAMLILAGSDCNEGCEQMLYLSRQVHSALGKDSNRVIRFLLVSGHHIAPAFHDLLDASHPDLVVRHFSADSLRTVFGDLVEPSGDYLFLMDPNGNIMMYYTSELAGKPLLKDLKYLLKVSTIG